MNYRWCYNVTCDGEHLFEEPCNQRKAESMTTLGGSNPQAGVGDFDEYIGRENKTARSVVNTLVTEVTDRISTMGDYLSTLESKLDWILRSEAPSTVNKNGNEPEARTEMERDFIRICARLDYLNVRILDIAERVVL